MKCAVCSSKSISVISSAGALCGNCEWEAKFASREFRNQFLRKQGIRVKTSTTPPSSPAGDAMEVEK